MRQFALATLFLLALIPCSRADDGKWEVSLSASLSGAKGNTEKTDAEAAASFLFNDGSNKVKSAHKYKTGKEDGDKNEDLWRSDISYLRRVLPRKKPARSPGSNGAPDRPQNSDPLILYLNLNCFAEKDRLSEISLRTAMGGGFTAEFFLIAQTEFTATLDWLREDLVSGEKSDRLAAFFEVSSRKILQNGLKLKSRSKMFIPLGEADAFFMQSEYSLEFPVTERMSLRLAAEVDFDNKPANASVKKTDFRYLTGLSFSL